MAIVEAAGDVAEDLQGVGDPDRLTGLAGDREALLGQLPRPFGVALERGRLGEVLERPPPQVGRPRSREGLDRLPGERGRFHETVLVQRHAGEVVRRRGDADGVAQGLVSGERLLVVGPGPLQVSTAPGQHSRDPERGRPRRRGLGRSLGEDPLDPGARLPLRPSRPPQSPEGGHEAQP